MTFGALFRTVATAAGAPPGAELSPAQRLRAIAVSVESRLPRLGPLRRSRLTSRLRPRLRAAARRAAGRRGRAGGRRGERRHARGLRLPERPRRPLQRLRRGPPALAAGSTRTGSRAAAIAALREDAGFWGGRPVFLYGFDDLTANQLELVGGPGGHRGGHRRRALRGGQHGAGGARAAAGAAARADRRRRGDRDRRRSRQHRQPAALPPRPRLRRPAAAAAAARARPDPAALRRDPVGGGGDRAGGLAAGPRRRRPGADRGRPARPRPPRRPRSRRRWRRTGSPPRWRPSCRSPGPRSAAP